MIKRIFILLVLIINLFLTFSLPSLGQSETKVYINNKKITTTTIFYEGVLYVPSQSIATALGISIRWDPSTQTLYVNNKPLGSKPLVISGTVNVPIEALSANIGAIVEWDGKENAIKITTGGNVANVTPTPGTPTPQPTRIPTAVVVANPTPLPTKLPTISSVFIPKSVSNDSFSVTVTNLEYQNIIKNYYTPKSGYRFCILNVSQQNISSGVQIYTGTFSLFDNDGHSYDYLEGLSNFWLQVLQPGGTNFGHLVYEIPIDAIPDKLVLYSVNNPTLSVDLF